VTVLRSRYSYGVAVWDARALPMISRTRILITAAFVCHLLLAPKLVTSQLHCPAPAPSNTKNEQATICAISQEKDGQVYKLHTRGKIHYRNLDIWADEATYDSDTGNVDLNGHVLLEGGTDSEHIEASHGTYNVQTEVGRFYDVVGTIGIREHPRRLLLTTSNPFAFTGKRVEKTGPEHYVVHDGTITTCEIPHPKWQFNAHTVKVEAGGNALIYRSDFRIHGLPVFYFPFATHPVDRQARKSGFLTPTVGRSSTKGTIFGDGFYWAVRRDLDITVGAEYFSRRGSAEYAQLRARPTERSFFDLTYFGVIDRGIPGAVTVQGPNGVPTVVEKQISQGGEEVKLNAQDRFGRFRAVSNIDYLSSFAFRVVFNEVFNQAVFSEVKSQAYLSNTTRGFSYNADVRRYQNFESTNNGDVITILHAPGFEFSSVDHKIGHSPFYWNLGSAAEGLSRSEPSFRTAPLVARLDLNPNLSLPMHFSGWSLRPEVGVRDTVYSQKLVPSSSIGTAANQLINRRALEGTIELRPPSVERVFNRPLLGHKVKHVVEPRVIYRRVTGVDDFNQILRFDERDILSDTNEVEYGFINRLYMKQKPTTGGECPVSDEIQANPARSPTMPPDDNAWEETTPAAPATPPTNCVTGSQAREFLSWELAQKYFLDPNFGGALVSGRRNVLSTTADFTAIAFLTGPRNLSPLISRLRVQPGSHIDAQWDLDYDFLTGRINSSTLLLNYHWGLFTFGGGDAYLQVPGEIAATTSTTPGPTKFHQFRVSTVYGQPTKRGFSGATSVGVDANRGFVQYAALQTTYNWDCCGVSVEYRRFALGSLRNENQYRFTFSLANVGSFGNLAKRERLY